MKNVFVFLMNFALTSCFLNHWDGRLELINKTNKTIKYVFEVAMNKSDTIPAQGYYSSKAFDFKGLYFV